LFKRDIVARNKVTF